MYIHNIHKSLSYPSKKLYDDTDARLQEEVLKKTVSLAKQLDVQLVTKTILPRVHGLALRTTVAAVIVNALLCLSDIVVDHSAPTLMCTLGVANAILKQENRRKTRSNVNTIWTAGTKTITYS